AKPERNSLVAMLVLGTGLEITHAALRPDRFMYLTNAGAMYGVAALVVASFEATRAGGEERRKKTLLLMEAAIFPAFIVVARMPVELTVILHPTSLDARLMLLDRTIFGGAPAFAVGRLFGHHPVLRLVEMVIYIELPVAAAIVFVAERRAKRRSDLQVA